MLLFPSWGVWVVRPSSDPALGKVLVGSRPEHPTSDLERRHTVSTESGDVGGSQVILTTVIGVVGDLSLRVLGPSPEPFVCRDESTFFMRT